MLRNDLLTFLKASEGINKQPALHAYGDSNGNVTIGWGHLIPNQRAFEMIQFETYGDFDQIKIRRLTWAYLTKYISTLKAGRGTSNAEKDPLNIPAPTYEPLTKIRITYPTALVLLEKDLDSEIEQTRSVFAELNILPEDAQFSLIDMIFNLGRDRFLNQFKSFLKGVAFRNWRFVSNESRRNLHADIYKRNNHDRNITIRAKLLSAADDQAAKSRRVLSTIIPHGGIYTEGFESFEPEAQLALIKLAGIYDNRNLEDNFGEELLAALRSFDWARAAELRPANTLSGRKYGSESLPPNWYEYTLTRSSPGSSYEELPASVTRSIRDHFLEAAKEQKAALEDLLRGVFAAYDNFPQLAKDALLTIAREDAVENMRGSFIKFVQQQNWYMAAQRSVNAVPDEMWNAEVSDRFFAAYEAERAKRQGIHFA